jgi:DNA polymerase-3 subunit alpha
MESLERTYHIAHDRIERFYPDNEVRLPDFVVPEGQTDTTALVDMAIDGLKAKNLHKNQEYVDRLKRELYVIKDRKFSKYFLTMKQVSDLAQEDRLTGPGRGSAAGALLSYVLGITQVDPIKYGLQFERFMRRDATDYPDIDYDLGRPMEFKEKLIEKWGNNVVVPISNYNTLQPKSLIKDISKFYGIPFQDVNKVTSVMEDEAIPKAKAKHGIKAGVYKPTFDELIEYSESLKEFLGRYPDVETHVKVLRGQVRSQSRHAGGVVIGQDLDYYMPLVKSKGVTQTPWSEGQRVHHLEPMGFIKYDLLGLQTLEIIELAIRLILKNKNGVEPTFAEVKSFYNENLNPNFVEFDDPSVYENIFHKGRFAATFQFTEQGAQQFCEEVKPNNIVDIAAVTSIFRPGPLGAGVDEKYLEARYNPSAIHYANHKVKEVTQETLGFLVFQEQIAALANALGKDISLDEANKLRKILTKNTSSRIGKRIPSEEENKIYAKFIAGCVEDGMGKQTAQVIWDSFIFFSAYGFNKSHAVCYSIISYQCAWLLHYYSAEWLASYLTNVDDKKMEEAISIAKQFGFKIGSLNINESEFTWQVGKDKTLVPPLTSIKGIGEKTVHAIMKHKPFNTIEELMFHEEINGREVGKKQLDAFIRSEALSNLMDDRFTGEKHFWTAVAVDKPKTIKKLNENIEKYRSEGEFSKAEKLLNIQSLTGNYPIGLVVSEDILYRIKEHHVPAIGAWDKADPLHRTASGKAMCWFVPIEKIVKKTGKGKDYWILKVVDTTGAVTEIKCWGVQPKDKIILHHPFMAALDYDSKWGFSTRGVNKLRLLG